MSTMPNQPRAGTSTHSMRMEDDLWAAAKAKAEAEGLDMSGLIRRLLTEYVES
jgi:antitoxin component of RelBE/YafQ-DinJ toxin-antitoxin module